MPRMDLETFRTRRGLSYKELADLIEVTQPKQARSYAIGQSWPRSAQLEKILLKAKGVTLTAMHRRRVCFLRQIEETDAA